MKHILITGASSGIGQALAILAARDGFKLSLCGRNQDKLNATVSELPTTEHTLFRSFCLSDKSKIDQFVADALTSNGPIDILVNCAGINNVRLSGDLVSTEQLDWLMKINCYAPIQLMQAVLPSMKSRGSGTIVNILSTVCLFSNCGISAYTASKSALDSYTKVMRKELAEYHVKMLSVYPGGVDSDFRECPRPEYLSPNEVASTVIKILACDDNTHIHELVLRPEIERNFV